MPPIPREESLDSTLALLREGYTFVSTRCRRYRTDVFQTRILLQDTICMRGKESARVFYDEDLFQRSGAAPTRVEKTLFGQGGVQGLDDEAHRRRKQMFMTLMTPEGIDQLAELMADRWRAALEEWEQQDEVVLFREVQKILCRAVCAWTGVPLPEDEVQQRTNEMAAMIDGAGAVGPRHWRGRWGRWSAERWIGNLIEQVRAGEREVAEDRALHAVAWHRDTNGELLDPQVAAVELINILRPTVAIARYVTFLAHALHEHPTWRQKLRTGDEEAIELFVQETRRYYPFFPYVAARTRRAFEWDGYRFPEDVRVLLDLYGTNHDARLWERPELFRPERFRDWDGNAFTLIPQGGSDHHTHHRCAGEWITIAVMKRALRLMNTIMSYEVPEQDLRIDLSRVPAIPKSRFVIRNVRRVPQYRASPYVYA